MEVMVSIGMLGLAALSLLTVFVGGLQLMQRSNEMAAANDIAKSTLEAIKRDFRLHQFAALPSGDYVYESRGDTPDAADTNEHNTFPPAPYPQTTINGETYNLVVEGRDEGSRLKFVKVTVYWGESQNLSLETLIHP
jgi:type II secretory pathway pseudopilin PulG